MKVFCDTNVLVAAFRANHPHHHAAFPILERIAQGKDEGFFAAHSLAEVYAVMTRLPGAMSTASVWQLISANILRNFTVITLTAKDYADVIESIAAEGIEGGRTYDALLLRAAEKSGATRILTFNVAHFQGLATDSVKAKISSP